MKYKGYLLKESLQDKSILEFLDITDTEIIPRPEHMKADYIDDVWTGIVFVGDADEVDHISELLVKAIKSRGWFLDIHTDTDNYLVFHKTVIKYPRCGEKQPWPREAIEAARKAEIPGFLNAENASTEEI
jgi:hypothetical protein